MFTSGYLNNALNNIGHNDHEESLNRILTKNNLKYIHHEIWNFFPLKFTNLKIASLC